jgi:uncharacterized protein (DUF2267 family)
MSTGLAVFDTTINETNEWLKEVETELCCDRRQAFVALRTVMHVLRDRLAPGGAMRLAAQLPILLRGVFVEGWRPDETPHRTHTAEAFVGLVAEGLPKGFPIGADIVTRTIVRVLWSRMNGGAMAKVREELPADIVRLWPEASLIA